jgi:hypothetical protein
MVDFRILEKLRWVRLNLIAGYFVFGVGEKESTAFDSQNGLRTKKGVPPYENKKDSVQFMSYRLCISKPNFIMLYDSLARLA